MLKNKVLLFLFLFPAVSSILIFNSCGKKSSDNQTNLNGGVKSGGSYTINELQELRSLDPVRINDVISGHIGHQIYDLLVDLDSNLNLAPDIASRWEISPDAKEYLFHLRKGVLFHDNKCFPNAKGRELTAADVKYSFERTCNPLTQTVGFDYFKNKVVGATEYNAEILTSQTEKREPKIKEVKGFQVVDDSTFKIVLNKPFAPFIYTLTLSVCYIEPREAVEFYKQDFFQNPVGTGAFTFDKWSPGLELTMKKNPNYWMKDQFGNQLPYVDNVKFRFIKEHSVQFLEFKQGSLDECYRFPVEFFKEVVDESKNLKPEYSKFILQRVMPITVQYYGFLTTSKTFSNKKLRQALCYAIDREKIMSYVLNGQASMPAIYGIVPPSMPNYDAKSIKGYNYDVAKAKQLLSEAGYPDGRGLPDITLQLNEGGGRNVQVAEAIQNMLGAIGVKIKLQILEFAQHLDNIDAGRTDFFRLGWVADYPEPENFLNLMYGKLVPESGISPINNTRYKNPKFDEIFEKALSTPDQTERYKLYLQAEQLAMEDAPYMLIVYDEDYRLLQPYVRGYKMNAMDRLNFRTLWLDK